MTLCAGIQAQDYFPLQTGNVWVYSGTGSRNGSPLIVEVTGAAQFGGVTYSAVSGLSTDGPVYLRQDANSDVYAYDAAAAGEKLWWSFQSPDGVAYPSAVSCCGKAMVASHAAKYSGAVGSFDYALEMRYPGVFQVGIDRDLFLPYIGLISRSIATGGPSYGGYDLIYARIGGVTVVSAPEVTFSLTLDRAAYSTDSTAMTARFTLRATQPQPLTLTFPTGQMFDFVVRTESGREVYRWSIGKFFTLGVQTLLVNGEKNWVLPLNLSNANGMFPAGVYTAEAYLTTSGVRAYTSTVGFEIK